MGIEFIARYRESNILQHNEKCVILNFRDVATSPEGAKYFAASSSARKSNWTKLRLV